MSERERQGLQRFLCDFVSSACLTKRAWLEVSEQSVFQSLARRCLVDLCPLSGSSCPTQEEVVGVRRGNVDAESGAAG